MSGKVPSNENVSTWSESDSQTYRKLAAVAVPEREEQMATILALLPFERDATFTAVELGSGEGYLSEALLACFPNASVSALDGSAEMRAVASNRLERFGERFRVEHFDITNLEWANRIHGVDCVVSSLCVHHLDARGKQGMFAGVFQQLVPGGALIVADLVAPTRAEATALFASTWDREARSRSEEIYGSDEGFDIFVSKEWNHYRHPDPTDQPSPLFDLLQWISEAGFGDVGCFWMKAGHAIYGGYKPGGVSPSHPLDFDAALSAVEASMKDAR